MDSAIYVHVSFLLQILLPSSLPHNTEQSSLCYPVGPCWLPILNTAVCTCGSQTLWGLSSLTRDWTWAMAMKAQNPNHWATRELPKHVYSSALPYKHEHPYPPLHSLQKSFLCVMQSESPENTGFHLLGTLNILKISTASVLLSELIWASLDKILQREKGGGGETKEGRDEKRDKAMLQSIILPHPIKIAHNYR